MYGTIRMHQEREHPERVSGTDLVNPDFAAMGRAMGCHAETVTRTDEFAPAFERAVKSGKAALIELRTDPELISTRLTITALRDAAKARAAKEAFITGAGSLALPVVSVDGKPVGDGSPGPVASKLRRLYIERAKATAI